MNFKIRSREIGDGCPVFIVAEISANHNQDFQRAKDLVKVACETGVDGIKLQTYSAETMTIDCDKDIFQVKVNKDWKGKTLYELYKEAYMPWEWHKELKKIAEENGKIIFSTPFDETAVDFLEDLNVPCYKVASFEIGDLELLKKIAKTQKPVIVSRGMASIEEMDLAIKTLKENGTDQIAFLQCVSSYPVKADKLNLATIKDIKKRFKVVPGLSDHSLSVFTASIAVALGACIVEKHFTLKRSDGGVDSSFSLEPKEMRELVKKVRETEKIIGRSSYCIGEEEKEIAVFKRSLFVVKDIKKEETFNRENVRCIRPGHGLAPKFLKDVLGKKANKNIERGTPLSLDLII